MLVLTRKVNESVLIGDDVQITVVEVRGEQVRLGITAPAELAVYRKEIYDEIKRENVRAAHPSQSGLELLSGIMLASPSREGVRAASEADKDKGRRKAEHSGA